MSGQRFEDSSPWGMASKGWSALDRTPELGDTLLVEVVDINLVHRRVRLLLNEHEPS
ncbi:hypothetical protein AB0283_15680 [Micromonospora vinacea]|uniref:hypothetical protein n=1 Tax=Micromonospora vinacea TaxID=709878 RepID=UPI00344E26A9